MTKFKERSMKNKLGIVFIVVYIVCRDVCCGTDQPRIQLLNIDLFILNISRVYLRTNLPIKGKNVAVVFQGPIGTIIIFRQCVSHIFYKKAIRYHQKATFL